VKVSCRNAVKWRNNHCFGDTYGVEYDWMQFLWNVNTVSADKSTMADLQAIYEGACGGSCSGSALTWDALNGGAAAYY
jgi:hypothetical protein